MFEVRDLVKVYPGMAKGERALVGVSLRIPNGMFGLLGPNGSGKTTLMRILAGLLEPTSGSLHFDSTDVTGRPDLVWPRLGYLPQDFGFYPNLTGEQMLTHMLKLKGVTAPGGHKALVGALLERVNLTAPARRKVKGYSGGMRQRLGIAQAIAGDPDLIIVDEPTAGLDPEERLRFYRLLAELGEQRTVLLSTHIVEDVAMSCPRFAVIRGGRLLANTTPQKAREALKGKVYEGEVTPNLAAALPQIARVIQSQRVDGQDRVRIYIRNGPPPPSFMPSLPTLEDAYFVTLQTSGRPSAEDEIAS